MPPDIFQLFPTEEDAVLGLLEPILIPEQSSGLAKADDLFAQMSRLLITVARSAGRLSFLVPRKRHRRPR